MSKRRSFDQKSDRLDAAWIFGWRRWQGRGDGIHQRVARILLLGYAREGSDGFVRGTGHVHALHQFDDCAIAIAPEDSRDRIHGHCARRRHRVRRHAEYCDRNLREQESSEQDFEDQFHFSRRVDC